MLAQRETQLGGAFQGAVTDKSVERYPQIQQQLDNLRRELEFHESLIMQLGERLVPLMSLTQPSPNNKTEKENEPTC